MTKPIFREVLTCSPSCSQLTVEISPAHHSTWCHHPAPPAPPPSPTLQTLHTALGSGPTHPCIRLDHRHEPPDPEMLPQHVTPTRHRGRAQRAPFPTWHRGPQMCSTLGRRRADWPDPEVQAPSVWSPSTAPGEQTRLNQGSEWLQRHVNRHPSLAQTGPP